MSATVRNVRASLEPITIRLASEAGRNGTVIIDGGLTQWAGCSEYASEPTPPSAPNGAGTRDTGITLGTSQWIILDGTKWGGIEVRRLWMPLMLSVPVGRLLVTFGVAYAVAARLAVRAA